MARQGEPADLRLIVTFLRSLRRWTQEEFSRASGVDRSLISDYELGNKAPTRRTLERLAAGVGLPYVFVETLLPIFRAARLATEGRQESGDPSEAGSSERLGNGLERAILDAVMPGLIPLLLEMESRMNEAEGEEAGAEEF